ncbi:MAG TPA: hypothetical protein VF550_07315 [Polyangia bacterium]
MILSSLQHSGQFLRNGFLLAVSAAAYLAGCGGDSTMSKSAPNAIRDAGAINDAGTVSIVFKSDAASSLQPSRDASVNSPSVDGGQSTYNPPPVVSVPGCTAGTTTLHPRPAEALLVLDRSSSMADTITADGTSKWNAAVSAIESAVLASQDTTAWGMMLFPKGSGDSACCQMPANDLLPSVEATPALQSAQAIAAALAQSSPGGVGTPTARALVQAANVLLARATSTSKFIVLATGGEPTCASDGVCDGAATTDYTRTKETVAHVASVLGIPVAVVGIALPSASNSLQPNGRLQLFTDLANFGGMANTTAGQPAYYSTGTTADLGAALGSLSSKMTSCSFALPNPVAWPDNVAVLFAENRIAQDTSHQEGWDYGDRGTSVVLFGQPCDDARKLAGRASLDFVTGCPAAPVVALSPHGRVQNGSDPRRQTARPLTCLPVLANHIPYEPRGRRQGCPIVRSSYHRAQHQARADHPQGLRTIPEVAPRCERQHAAARVGSATSYPRIALTSSQG